jgi:hypothetical protein
MRPGWIVVLSLLSGCTVFDLIFPPVTENCGGDSVVDVDGCRQCCSGLANIHEYHFEGPGECRCE